MPTLSSSQLPPPKNWKDLEIICRDVWARLWGDPHTQMNGREGQPQAGVDVYGYPGKSDTLAGIQCKNKDVALNKPLTRGEVQRSIRSAREFSPRLSELIIATVARKDEKLQELVRKLSLRSREDGFFSISILFWDEIQGHLCSEENRDLLIKHWPDLPTIDERANAAATPTQVDEYNSAFVLEQSRGLDPLVPTKLSSNGSEVAASEFIASLRSDQTVHLHGPSGAGKSHLARHLALDLANQGLVPVFVKATLYSNELNLLLDRSTSTFSKAAAKTLFAACDGGAGQLLLVIDGLNEASPQAREALVNELIAFRRRHRGAVLVTNRQECSCAERLPGQVFELAFLGPSEKAAFFTDEDKLPANVIEVLRTPLDIKIAKEGMAALGDCDPTPFSLLNSFVRRRLPAASAVGFQVLTEVAAAMNERLSSAVSAAELHRVVEQFAPRAAEEVVQSLYSSGLLVMAHGYVSFWHERLQRFFQTEGLLRSFPDPGQLAAELRRPRNEDCTELALSALQDVSAVRTVFEAVNSLESLASVLSGWHGQMAQGVADASCRQVLAAANADLGGLQLIVEDTRGSGGRELKPRSTRVWSGLECRVLNLIGRRFVDGKYCGEVLSLVEATDKKCTSLAHSMPVRRAWGELFPYLYSFSHPAALPVNAIVQSARTPHRPWAAAAVAAVARRMEDLDAATPGLLVVFTEYFRNSLWIEVEQAVPREFLPFLRRCWDTGLCHLRLDAADLAGYAEERLDSQRRAEVEELLESWLGSDPFLNSNIFEALARYRDLEIVSAESVREEIRQILESSAEDDLPARAASCYDRQFEDVLGTHYYDGLAELDAQERLRFFVLAGLGIDKYSFFLTSLLRELMDSAAAEAKPVFERWRHPPEPTGILSSDKAGVFLLAHLGLAKVSEQPPALELTGEPNSDSWKVWGEIVYWIYKVGCDSPSARQQCAPLWRMMTGPLLLAAIDPWYQVENYAASRSWSTIQWSPISKLFPHEAKQLLETILPHLDSLTGVFPTWVREANERACFVISELGQLGDAATLVALQPYLESEALGATATRAAREIQDRLHGRASRGEEFG